MKTLSEPAKRRLVLLERLLASYEEKTVTSQKIAELTGWSAAVVRRDIFYLEVKCGASNGYRVSDLQKSLKAVLGISGVQKKCCIVGLTRMGQVLLDNAGLDDSPFEIVAGFDSNVNRTEVLRSSFPLHPTTMLEHVIKEKQIEYAILTAGENEAQTLVITLRDDVTGLLVRLYYGVFEKLDMITRCAEIMKETPMFRKIAPTPISASSTL